MATIYELNNWDQNLLSTAITSPNNAVIFGLTIIDTDKALRRRSAKIKTSDLYIPFQYIENIPAWSKQANYSEYSEIIGRFEPVQMYSNSAAQEISLELTYAAEARYNNGATTHWTLENIEKYDKKLRSLMFPMYTKGYGSPSKLKLNIGNMFVNTPVLVKGVESTNEAPYDIITGLSMMRKIKLTCVVSYPMWQAISMEQVYVEKAGNGVFAYQEMTVDQLAKTTSQLSREQRVAQYREYLTRGNQ